MIDEINRFVNFVRRRSLNAHTYQDYRCDLQQFLTIVGDQSPANITVQDVDEFIADQSERGLKPATINRRLTAVPHQPPVNKQQSTAVSPPKPPEHVGK